ncbi:hypothetical protein [Spirosoma fluviale]|uniref:hypothetical protein n=1 Tax=Spirosoma fluviale TaxID=1597977 RepID=UPI000BE45BA5|nr:hypothetical protein [Spirosoma fluviale]
MNQALTNSTKITDGKGIQEVDMTHTITIETTNPTDFELIKGLAQRLGLPIVEKHEDTGTSHAAQEFMELQKKYPPRKISKEVDLNAIIDEVNL